ARSTPRHSEAHSKPRSQRRTPPARALRVTARLLHIPAYRRVPHWRSRSGGDLHPRGWGHYGTGNALRGAMTSPKLCCPHCQQFESRVVDSRQTKWRKAELTGHIYRRRECEHCHQRFTTQEVVIGVYQKSSTSTLHHNI